MIDENRLYSLAEVADITGLKLSNLRIWANNGGLVAKKMGRAWYLTGRQVNAILGVEPGEQIEPGDVLKDIDLREIEIRIADLVEKVTGKPLEDDDRDELLDILETYMRIARTGENEE